MQDATADRRAHPWGWGTNPEGAADLAEALRLVREICTAGVSMIRVSMGYPRIDPTLGRPSSNDSSPEHPLVRIDRFIDQTAAIQRAAGAVPVVGAGLAWLRHCYPWVAAGIVRSGKAMLVGQGRGIFAYPDSVESLRNEGTFDAGRCCITCSKCSELMRRGGPAGCIVRDLYSLNKKISTPSP
jgi:2,4-dienoyl-CoA reductase-like NADH-dependent reductase (Old Yellow Enzyme family)